MAKYFFIFFVVGATDRGGRPSDKEHFADLLDELKDAFRSKRHVLAATVPPAV